MSKTQYLYPFLVTFLYSIPVHAWFCHEVASIRDGDTIKACGIGESEREASARTKALMNAENELDAICSISADCRDFELVVEPLRNECLKETDDTYKCYRGIKAVITKKKRKNDGEPAAVQNNPKAAFPQVEKEEKKTPTRKQGPLSDIYIPDLGVTKFIETSHRVSPFYFLSTMAANTICSEGTIYHLYSDGIAKIVCRGYGSSSDTVVMYMHDIRQDLHIAMFCGRRGPAEYFFVYDNKRAVGLRPPVPRLVYEKLGKYLPSCRNSEKNEVSPPPVRKTQREKNNQKILMIEKCAEGDTEACHTLGTIDFMQGNKTSAEIIFKKNCGHGHPESCYLLSLIKIEKGDVKKALQILRQSCALGDNRACSILDYL